MSSRSSEPNQQQWRLAAGVRENGFCSKAAQCLMQVEAPDCPDAARRRAGYRLFNFSAFCVLATVILLLCCAEAASGKTNAIELWGRELPDTCLNFRVTGKPCPGCGMTRSVVLLLDGRFAQARAMHASAPWIGAWFVGQLIARAILVIFAFRPRFVWLPDLIVSLTTLWLVVHVPMIHAALVV